MSRLLNGKRGLTDRQITQRQILQEQKRIEECDAKEKLKKKNEKKITEEQFASSQAAKKIGQRNKVLKEYSQFKRNLKEALVTEAIHNIYKQTIPQRVIDQLNTKGINVDTMERGFIKDFVNEHGGAIKMLDRWSRRNVLLSEYANTINNTYEKVMEDTNNEVPETFGLASGTKTQFYDSLSQATPDDVVEIIRGRITSSIGEFVEDNQKMKMQIKDICDQTGAKVAATDDDELKEHYQMKANASIRNYRDSKSFTVLQEVVKNIAKSIVKNENLREQYTNPDGRIDMETITNCGIVFYGLLETVNTMNMIKIDNVILDDILKKIK